MSMTVTVQNEAQESLDMKEVGDEAKKALSGETGFWAGVDWFLKWLQEKVASVIFRSISDLPIVGTWAARIGTTVSGFVFTVFRTFIGFLKVVFTAPTVWRKAHESAVQAWHANASSGLLAQIYAYGKKMAAFFLEIMVQCLERAIAAHNLQVTAADKTAITEMLNGML